MPWVSGGSRGEGDKGGQKLSPGSTTVMGEFKLLHDSCVLKSQK